jgi:nucleotidyltransferase/DNA polymerase involved in DNA repair
MLRTIVHIDLDAFYCAIEERRTPTLRGQTFAVGGQPDQRGVVASLFLPCSSAGRAFRHVDGAGPGTLSQPHHRSPLSCGLSSRF